MGLFRTKLLLLLFIANSGLAQDSLRQNIFVDTFQTEQFLSIVEQSLFDYYKATWGTERAYKMLDELGQPASQPTVDFPDSVYMNRLQYLTDISPFNAKPNATLLKTVKYFVHKRSRYTSVVIGRSKLYFPMFEEYLLKYDLPIELKYLPIIESALQPQGKSWAGALGLWQIMYRTGRMLDLYADSYVDDRLHPEKSTDAACRYLKYLFNLYGDWDLALAAYNSGPGNVNKAIRRAGGSTNYWAIRPYLPRETQMYVPNFYAMMYMMTFYDTHHIIPKQAEVYLYETDTVCLKASVRISHLDSILGLNSEAFKRLNPQYKTDIIPQTTPAQCISLHQSLIPDFFKLEDSLYAYQSFLDSSGQNYVILEKKTFHYVKPEETLAMIGMEYNVTVAKLREWNGLRNSSILPGQKIVVMIPEKRTLDNYSEPIARPSKKTSNSSQSITYSGNYKYYTLKSGESLWTVSKKLGIPFVDLQALNKDINPKKLKPGQKIRIGKQ